MPSEADYHSYTICISFPVEVHISSQICIVHAKQNFLCSSYITKSINCHLYTGLGFVAESLMLDENGGSGQICVIKRNGIVPSDGLTVELRFLRSGGSTLSG